MVIITTYDFLLAQGSDTFCHSEYGSYPSGLLFQNDHWNKSLFIILYYISTNEFWIDLIHFWVISYV